jgi:hypothetical protein
MIFDILRPVPQIKLLPPFSSKMLEVFQKTAMFWFSFYWSVHVAVLVKVIKNSKWGHNSSILTRLEKSHDILQAESWSEVWKFFCISEDVMHYPPMLNRITTMQDLRFSQWWLWRMPSYEMLRHVALVKTDVSEERTASIIRATIGELGTLAVTSNTRNSISSQCSSIASYC